MVPGMTDTTFAAPTGQVSLFPEFGTKAFRGAPGDVADGVMIAMYPPPDVADALAVPGGLPAAELHVTVAYPGSLDTVPDVNPLLMAADMITNRGPITAQIAGHARFTGGDGDVLVALVDSPDVEDLRRDLVDALSAQGVDLDRTHGYTAHITLGYCDPDDTLPLDRLEPMTVTFDALSVVHGEDRQDVPFGEADGAQPAVPGGLAAIAAEGKDIGGGAAVVPALGKSEYTKPHRYRRDPQSGAGNCECGAAKGDKLHVETKGAFKGAAAPFGKGGIGGGKGDDAGPKMATGAFVSLGGKKGRVDMVVSSGTVPGAKSPKGEPVEGDKDSPAARVVLYEASGAGTWKATGKKVAAKVGTLKRIPPLRTREGKSLAESIAGMIVDFTEDVETAPPSADVLRTVYERGAQSWPGETKTLLSREQWGLGRAEAFLATVAGDRPTGYVGDDDLLPTT